jgi:hypothetical protein
VTGEEHSKEVSRKKAMITRIKNKSKGDLTLAEKLDLKLKAKSLESELRDFILNYHDIISQ